MFKKPPQRIAVDGDAVVKEALRRIEQPSRRLFLRRSLTLGGLSLLTGCTIVDEDSAERALMAVSRFNDKVQGWLFDPQQLAPTYPESMITRPFPFNAYYGEDEIRQVDADSYRLEVTGRVADKRSWTLAALQALPQTDQVTRHICVEGWSAIGKWGGVTFADFLARVGADTSARFIRRRCSRSATTASRCRRATAFR
jgi:DMSO/TMAO reductase YedYZ molybdopterin-dependent catalytic subunit